MEKSSKQLVTIRNGNVDLTGLYVTSLPAQKEKTVCILMHGAGLDWKSPLYLGLADLLSERMDVILPGLRASGFVNYNSGFRKPLGWAYHRSIEALEDCEAWVNWVYGLGYSEIIVAGHSWGALLVLKGAYKSLKPLKAILLSPLPSTGDMIRANFEDAHSVIEEIRKETDDTGGLQAKLTRNGAPLAFLSVRTIQDLLNHQWDLNSVLDGWQGQVLILLGELEHSELITSVKDASLNRTNCRVINLSKQGHFYTTGITKIADEIFDWLY